MPGRTGTHGIEKKLVIKHGEQVIVKNIQISEVGGNLSIAAIPTIVQ